MNAPRAADCHAHVFGSGYPFAPDAVYLPEPSQMGTARSLSAVLEAHCLTHGLLVAAQPYGYDNRCLLAAIAGSGGRFKGVALVRPAIADSELRTLVERGVVGLRVNLSTYGLRELTEPGAGRLLARVKEMGWFLQVHCQADELVDAAPILRQAGVRIVIDHFGRPDIRRGTAQPGFATLLELGRTGEAVVKLSAPFRVSREGPPYSDVEPFIAAAVEAFTIDNVVWGSDWPFVRIDERIDYGPQLACVRRWFPDANDRHRLMWANPARLFGFD